MEPKPIVFISCGLTSYAQAPYLLNIAKEGVKRGYDVAALNHRGLAQAGLETTQWCTGVAVADADRVFFAYRTGELGEPAVLFGDDEVWGHHSSSS